MLDSTYEYLNKMKNLLRVVRNIEVEQSEIREVCVEFILSGIKLRIRRNKA